MLKFNNHSDIMIKRPFYLSIEFESCFLITVQR